MMRKQKNYGLSSIVVMVAAAGLFCFGAPLQAKDITDGRLGYELVYSAEQDTCNYFLQLFNGDIAKYGHVVVEDHKEFSGIAWVQVDKTTKDGQDAWETESIAALDINNDGKEEYVVRGTYMLHGPLSDSLYIFKDKPVGRADILKKLRAESAGEAKFTLAKFQRTGDFYYLKRLPPRTYTTGPFKGQSFFESIDGWFALYPLRYKESTYIGINQRKGPNTGHTTIDFTDWQIIARYLPNYELQDVCYFKGSVDKRVKQTVGRQ